MHSLNERHALQALLLIMVLYVVSRVPGYYADRQIIIQIKKDFNIDIEEVQVNGTDITALVRVYPKNHIIRGKEFVIVFENSRNERLRWGSPWKAWKFIDNEWILQEPPWAWTASITSIAAFSRHTDKYNISRYLTTGIYKIEKTVYLDEDLENMLKFTFYLSVI